MAHLDGKHVVFGEVQSGVKVLDRVKSVALLEPKNQGKPVPEQRVSLTGVAAKKVSRPVLTGVQRSSVRQALPRGGRALSRSAWCAISREEGQSEATPSLQVDRRSPSPPALSD